jgi:tellurite resistance protein TerC
VNTETVWIVFAGVVIALFAGDLVLTRALASARLRLRLAALRVAAWALLAVAFTFALRDLASPAAAGDFFAAYLKLLPVESALIFALVFDVLRIPSGFQVRVVMWGVVGALLARGTLTLLGAEAARAFGWLLPMFGLVLVFVGWRKLDLARSGVHVDLKPLKAWLWRVLNVRDAEPEQGFFTRDQAGLHVTPLLLALVLIEVTDVVVALDVIPAVLSITKDPFLLFAANAFALLVFRSLYFLIASAAQRLVDVPVAVALSVIFAGAKLAATPWWTMPTEIYLGVYATLILGGVVSSLLRTRGNPTPNH